MSPQALPKEAARLQCPHCGAGGSEVTNSRPRTDYIARRRECHGCGQRFATVEIVCAVQRGRSVPPATTADFQKMQSKVSRAEMMLGSIRKILDED